MSRQSSVNWRGSTRPPTYAPDILRNMHRHREQSILVSQSKHIVYTLVEPPRHAGIAIRCPSEVRGWRQTSGSRTRFQLRPQTLLRIIIFPHPPNARANWTIGDANIFIQSTNLDSFQPAPEGFKQGFTGDPLLSNPDYFTSTFCLPPAPLAYPGVAKFIDPSILSLDFAGVDFPLQEPQVERSPVVPPVVSFLDPEEAVAVNTRPERPQQTPFPDSELFFELEESPAPQIPKTPRKKPDPNAPKRPRGRPRKYPLPVSVASLSGFNPYYPPGGPDPPPPPGAVLV